MSAIATVLKVAGGIALTVAGIGLKGWLGRDKETDETPASASDSDEDASRVYLEEARMEGLRVAVRNLHEELHERHEAPFIAVKYSQQIDEILSYTHNAEEGWRKYDEVKHALFDDDGQ